MLLYNCSCSSVCFIPFHFFKLQEKYSSLGVIPPRWTSCFIQTEAVSFTEDTTWTSSRSLAEGKGDTSGKNSNYPSPHKTSPPDLHLHLPHLTRLLEQTKIGMTPEPRPKTPRWNILRSQTLTCGRKTKSLKLILVFNLNEELFCCLAQYCFVYLPSEKFGDWFAEFPDTKHPKESPEIV